jgi:predicted ABC-class ATPase
VNSENVQHIGEYAAKLDGLPYSDYAVLLGQRFGLCSGGAVEFVHIQGSPGAYPASVILVSFPWTAPDTISVAPGAARVAIEDYVLRVYQEGIEKYAQQNRGDDGSGSFQLLTLSQEVLERNIVSVKDSVVSVKARISLPGTSRSPKILGNEFEAMITDDLPAVIEHAKSQIENLPRLRRHIEIVTLHARTQSKLKEYGLVAFVGESSILPRASGISDAPLESGEVAFNVPDSLSVELTQDDGSHVKGLGIPQGITVIVGGGYHGKSTLLDALCRGVFPHVPDDGREGVVTDSTAIFVQSENGRSVRGTDISCRVSDLPGGRTARAFFTDDASGSTSQAASMVEAVQAGARLLLIDEDSSATNLLYRDEKTRSLVPRDPIRPLIDIARSLYEDHGVSIVLVSGAMSDYWAVADKVIKMQDYQPRDVTDRAKELVRDHKSSSVTIETGFRDTRAVDVTRLSADFFAARQGISVTRRIKPLRGQPKILEFGNDTIDLGAVDGIVDECQTLFIGYALYAFSRIAGFDEKSPTSLAVRILEMVEKDGFGLIEQLEPKWPLFLAKPRALDLAAAINRIRSLQV